MRRVNPIAVAAALVFSSVADAHPEFTPAAVNRYIKVSLIGQNRARIAYTLMLGQMPALIERKAADRDANGRIDDDEARALGQAWSRRVAQGLRITLDGAPATVELAEPVVGLAGDEVGPEAFSIDLVATVSAAAASEHTLAVDDTTTIDRLGESEVRIEESPLATVLAATRGPLSSATSKLQLRVVFVGEKFSALEDRSVSLRWREAARTDATPRAASWLVGAMALLGGLGLAAWAARRYWRRKG